MSGHAAIHDILRAQVRQRAGRAVDPTAGIMDTQSLHVSTNVPAATTGKDANKKVVGRKRGGIVTDVLGLIIAVVAVAAGTHENAVGTRLLDEVAAAAPIVTKTWVEQGFKKRLSSTAPAGASMGRSCSATRPMSGSSCSRPAGRWSRPSGS